MKTTQQLPPDYQPVYTLDLSQNKVAAIALNLGALALFLVFGVWFARLSMRLRPELWQSGSSVSVASTEIYSLVIALVLMLVLHELTHGLFFWVFTRQRPVFGFKLMYAYAAAPDWYLARTPFIITGAAPLVLLTLFGILLMLIVPLALVPGLIFFMTFNAAGSIADIYTVMVLLYQPKTVFIQDRGDSFTVFSNEAE